MTSLIIVLHFKCCLWTFKFGVTFQAGSINALYSLEFQQLYSIKGHTHRLKASTVHEEGNSEVGLNITFIPFFENINCEMLNSSNQNYSI